MKRPILAAIALVGLALTTAPAPLAAGPQQQAQAFPLCHGGARVTCVVDGDTFWLDGAKIRIADINTPETSQPQCPRESELGHAATARLQVLLGAGPFTLAPAPDGRDRDRYGRLLRVVLRDGRSIGTELVSAGLAEQWQGHRGNWC